MVEIKEIVNEISEDASLKDLKITSFIKSLEEENYGISENTKYLSNKLDKLLNVYNENGKDTKS